MKKLILSFIILIVLTLIGYGIWIAIKSSEEKAPYKCPETLNCMPALNSSEAKFCNWVENNCPNTSTTY